MPSRSWLSYFLISLFLSIRCASLDRSLRCFSTADVLLKIALFAELLRARQASCMNEQRHHLWILISIEEQCFISDQDPSPPSLSSCFNGDLNWMRHQPPFLLFGRDRLWLWRNHFLTCYYYFTAKSLYCCTLKWKQRKFGKYLSKQFPIDFWLSHYFINPLFQCYCTNEMK